MFRPHFERPSYTPTQNYRKNYSSVYLNFIFLDRKLRRQKIMHRMTANISWIQSACNFDLNGIFYLLGLFPNILNVPPFQTFYYPSLCCDCILHSYLETWPYTWLSQHFLTSLLTSDYWKMWLTLMLTICTHINPATFNHLKKMKWNLYLKKFVRTWQRTQSVSITKTSCLNPTGHRIFFMKKYVIITLQKEWSAEVQQITVRLKYIHL